MFEDFSEQARTPWDVWWLFGADCGIEESAPTDTVFEGCEREVDFFSLFHALFGMVFGVGGNFAAGEVDEEEEAIWGGGVSDVGDAETAYGVGARGGVVLFGGFCFAERYAPAEDRKEGIRIGCNMFYSTYELGFSE